MKTRTLGLLCGVFLIGAFYGVKEIYNAGRRDGFAAALPKEVVVDYDFYTVRGVTVGLGDGTIRNLYQEKPAKNLETGVQEFVFHNSKEVNRD